jgi:hypothetical protein
MMVLGVLMKRPWFVCLLAAATLTAQQPAPQQPAAPAPPAEPRERKQSGYLYDGAGRQVPGGTGVREERRDGTVERQETMRDAYGRPVTTRATQERVLSQQGENKTSERVIQRYDLDGRPTTKQVVRLETRREPDGRLVTTEVLQEQDLSGRMQLLERRTTTEAKTTAGGSGSVVVERPSFHGSLQVVERIDRVDSKKSEAVTESVSTLRRIDANGRLEERQREASVTTKSGNVTTRESKQWEFQPTGKLEFVGRSVSNLTERSDGSQVEETEVYTTRIAGTTPDLNRPGVPTLEQKIQREKKVQPDGRVVETTKAQIRTVADPGRLGGLIVTEQVTTPTPQGQTVEITMTERDANGRMQLVQKSVEEQKK